MHICMRTTIDIPDALLDRARPILASRNMTLRALVVDALERLLAAKGHRFKLADASVGYEAKPGEGVSAAAVNRAIDEMGEPSR